MLKKKRPWATWTQESKLFVPSLKALELKNIGIYIGTHFCWKSIVISIRKFYCRLIPTYGYNDLGL